MASEKLAADRIQIAATKEESATACAAFVLETLHQAIASQRFATFAISGGATPRLLFQDLAKAKFPWEKLHVFWVDERCVPPHDEQSNFKLADETWLTPADIPAANIHRIRGELIPDEAALQYVGDIQQTLSLPQGKLPEFDLVHRGMGPDAHTASLFPGEPLIENQTGIAAAVWVEKFKSHRVTLLPGVLERARCTVLQIAGADKADPAREVLHGALDPMKLPCQIATRGSNRAYWFFDKPAAQKL